MKRILAINDLSYVGRAALMANIPIISSFGHQVIPCPTVLLTRHTGYDSFKVHHLNDFFDQTIDDLIDHQQPLNAILIGYLDGIHQIDPIMKLLDHYPNAFVFVDPICADNGKFYHGKNQGYINALKPLLKRADLIKPNITEALALCGRNLNDYRTIDQGNIQTLINELQKLTSNRIILTGIQSADEISNVLVDGEGIKILTNKYVPCYIPGTGDIFDSIVISAFIQDQDLNKSMQRAMDFVLKSIELTTVTRRNDLLDGSLFETLISMH